MDALSGTNRSSIYFVLCRAFDSQEASVATISVQSRPCRAPLLLMMLILFCRHKFDLTCSCPLRPPPISNQTEDVLSRAPCCLLEVWNVYISSLIPKHLKSFYIGSVHFNSYPMAPICSGPGAYGHAPLSAEERPGAGHCARADCFNGPFQHPGNACARARCRSPPGSFQQRPGTI